MKNRVEELDFLKCFFILLMITFHLVFIGEKYPYVKEVIYTFHVPAFFVISGYLMRTDKTILQFLLSMFWMLVPYIIMESGYILMCSCLPVREHIETLSWQVFADKLLLHPLGPYWYLHTLIVCGVTYYISFFRFSGGNILTRLLISSVFFTAFAFYWGIVSPSSVMYFMIGAIIRQSSVEFMSFFRSSWLSVLFFALMIIFPENLDRFTVSGLIITYLAISILLSLYKISPSFFRKYCCYIGRHTLVLLVFSPIFTFAVKPLVQVLSFEPTGILFMFLSLAINVYGCFLIAHIMDKIRITPFIFGKENIIEPIH